MIDVIKSSHKHDYESVDTSMNSYYTHLSTNSYLWRVRNE